MLIGFIPFTATEVQAVTIPVGDITTNDSFGNGDTWQDGDQIKIERTVGYDSDCYTYTASVDENGITTWALDKKLYWDGKEVSLYRFFAYILLKLYIGDFGLLARELYHSPMA